MFEVIVSFQRGNRGLAQQLTAVQDGNECPRLGVQV